MILNEYSQFTIDTCKAVVELSLRDQMLLEIVIL